MKVDPTTLTFGLTRLDLPHEGSTTALAYAISGSLIVASCQLEPWGMGVRPFLSRFHVVPEFRRNGVGRRLLQAVVRECERLKLESLAMWVHHANKAAEALYRSEGFVPFYQNDDNVFFARRIGSEFGRLPRTADGAPVVPGMTIYRPGQRGNVNVHEVDAVRPDSFFTTDGIHFNTPGGFSTRAACELYLAAKATAEVKS